MINRLISSLSFNPSLVEELSLYGKKLRREQPIRLIGFVIIILSLLLQLIAANMSSEKSLNASDNDIISGGITTKSEILSAWDNPGTQAAEIYGKFGVTRKDIADIPGNRPNARIKSEASNFWIAGRSSLTGYSNSEQQEIAISTAGPTIFLRPLRAWDTDGRTSVYEAFMGHNSTTGEAFWISASGGNYIQNGPGRLPPPKLQVSNTIVGNTGIVKPGGLINFSVEYRNRQQNSLAEDVKIIDNLPLEKIDIISPGNLSVGTNNNMVKSLGGLRYTDYGHIFNITVRAKDNLRDGTRICDTVRLTSSNAGGVSSGPACIEISRTIKASLMTSAPRDIMPPGLREQVSNITQGLSGQETLQSEVHAGDILEYTLATYNYSNRSITSYNVKDFIGDVTDYANLDTSFLATQGGTYDKQSKEVVWPNRQIKPGQSLTNRFRVIVKNPLPSTNKPSTASTNFDCKISNEYGNELTMSVRCPAAKSLETFPNTTSGSAILITSAIAIFSGYFLVRNSLLSKELSILRKNYASAGGDK
ncbi:MAG TPA: hypothetical protein VFW77_04435 [Candidatus Saccharimonadales bacterium]|nr:hypothetical protein [Candidatus Saccharimonadales bacterium]